MKLVKIDIERLKMIAQNAEDQKKAPLLFRTYKINGTDEIYLQVMVKK